MRAHRIIAASFIGLAACLAGAESFAQGAYTYGRGSVSLMQHGDLVTFSNTTGVLFGGGPASFIVGLGGTVRITVRQFLIQPGIAFGAVGGFTGVTGVGLAVSPSLGIGGAIPISPTFALSPMLRTSVTIIPNGGSSVVVAPLSAELPFTIFVGNNGIIEPFINVGALFLSNGGSRTDVFGSFGAGYRLGVQF